MAFNFRLFIILSSVLFGCAMASYGQQSPQALFDKANQQLEEGNFNQANSLYHRLESANTVSGALFLNMGIAYQRIDSLGKAKYYFMKALKFEETEKRAATALEFVEKQFSHQSAVLPKLPWDEATDWLQYNVGANNLLFAAILLLNFGILTFITHWFVSWKARAFKIAGIAIISISILVIAASFYTHYLSSRYNTAVMVTQKEAVVEEPNAEASLVSQAFEGYTFTVDRYRSRSQPGWSYVRMSNGLYGWIPNSEILIL